MRSWSGAVRWTEYIAQTTKHAGVKIESRESSKTMQVGKVLNSTNISGKRLKSARRAESDRTSAQLPFRHAR